MIRFLFLIVLYSCATRSGFESSGEFKEYYTYMIDSSVEMVYPGSYEEMKEFQETNSFSPEAKYRPLLYAQKYMLFSREDSFVDDHKERFQELTFRAQSYVSNEEFKVLLEQQKPKTPFDLELMVVNKLNERVLFKINERLQQAYSSYGEGSRQKGVAFAGVFFRSLANSVNNSPSYSAPVRSPASCSSDYECGQNQACGSKNSLGLGVCMNVVNQYNQTDYGYQKSFGVKKFIECSNGVCP